jgi:hypothetical protein
MTYRPGHPPVEDFDIMVPGVLACIVPAELFALPCADQRCSVARLGTGQGCARFPSLRAERNYQ